MLINLTPFILEIGKYLIMCEPRGIYFKYIGINNSTHIILNKCRIIYATFDATRLRYNTGDHIGLYPQNDQREVESLIEEIPAFYKAKQTGPFRLVYIQNYV